MKPIPIPDDVSGEHRLPSYSLRRESIMKGRADDDKPFEGGTLGVGEQIDAMPGDELLAFAGSKRFATVLADPPWRFSNRTGKIAPEHRRLSRYSTMAVEDIAALPVAKILKPTAHLYLWVPSALLPDGLKVMAAWGFNYKTMISWHKLRKDGGSDGRGVGFYFRNVTESLLFGVRGKNARTLAPGRTQVNYIGTRKREHSRKPDEQYKLIEDCSPGPFLEMFARGVRPNWSPWGNQADGEYEPTWKTYPHNSATERRLAESDKSLQFAFMLPKQRRTARHSSDSNASAAKTSSSSIGSTTCLSTQSPSDNLPLALPLSSARAPAEALGVKQQLEKTLARNGKLTT